MGQDIFDLVIILTLVFFTLRGARVGLVGKGAGEERERDAMFFLSLHRIPFQ